MISDEKFRKKEHILKSKEFRVVYKKGRSAKKTNVVMYAIPNSLDNCRIGFSIGSRNIKRASRRNRIRRLFKEAYRFNKKAIKSPHDIVIVVRSDTRTPPSYASTEGLFLKLLGELGCLAQK